MEAVNQEHGRMFFLYGYGGIGKTHMWRTLTYALRSEKQIVLTVASSGIASLLLPRGRTTHSKFKILVPSLENSICNIHQGSELVGQILPVIPRGCRSDIVGDGKLSEPNDGCVEIDIPDELLILNFDNSIEAIVSSTYPDLHLHYNDEQFLQCMAILASTIDVVDQINEYVLSIIQGEEKEYLSSDSVDMSDISDIEVVNVLTPEFLNKLSTSGIPNHKIKLKIGTPIMLLRNLDQPEGLCNGTRLIVTQMANHVLEAKIMSGKNIGNIIYIPRMSMSPSQTQWPFKLIRRQFPIIVSYAMTINKSQGQSLESVGLYLPKPVFSHGQLYVAISRVKSKKGLKILIHDKDGNPLKSTTNVVYKEIFQNL
ncbi:hypothetical protein Lal_00023125 [Lupinus albus]|nr:hypothetical protein Lal_00023125 [Lupinus albus]